MRARVLHFTGELRRHGVDVSVAETMDALAAVAVAGVARETLREALAATLVKDERDRAIFDPLFDVAFPLVGPDGEGDGTRRRRGAAGGGGSAPGRGRGGGTGTGTGTAPPPDAPAAGPRPATPPPAGDPGTARRDAAPHDERPGVRDDAARGPRAARRAALLALPFAEMTARDVAEARELVAELGRRLRGRLARRERLARRGRVDLRRTLRAAVGTGGVPLRLRRRTRRPGRPDLVALCDVSGSVAVASELLLGLLAPARAYFRRVETFAFVDRLVPVGIERGHVAPDGPIDLHARSDFGRVLADLWPAHAGAVGPSTVLLVLGDARNNRLPPRVDLWRAVTERAGRVVWLVPEPRVRWDTGDSALGRYAPSCDAVVECLALEALASAVRHAI